MDWRVFDIDRGRYAGWMALAVAALLAAVAVWLLVRLVWLLVPRSDAVLDARSARAADPAAAPAPQSIAKWHLFGNTPARASLASGASATALGFQLRGTLADADPAAGLAVISDAERGERVYKTGESLATGVTLARVYPDSVVLLHDGKEETLKLPRERDLVPGEIVRPKSAAARVRGASGAAPESSAKDERGAARAPADWQQTVERLRRNPEELAKRVQIVPVLDGGRLAGVRVSAGTDAALLTQLGLKSGDVVTAIDGAPVDSVSRGQAIIESLKTASRAHVTVLRDGKPTDVTISLK